MNAIDQLLMTIVKLPMAGICSARVPRAMKEAMKDHPIARGTRALQGGPEITRR